jgi:diguanylate cyclase (GGDEF)-like protein
VLLRQNRRTTEALIDERMLDIVRVVAASVDGDVLRSLKATDRGNILYQRVYNQLRLYYENIELEYIYAINIEPDGTFTFSVDPATDAGVFGAPVVATEALRTAALGTPAVDAEPYTDDWGTFYSAYAPVFDSRGDVAAVIAVDFDANWYEAQLRKNSAVIAIVAVISALVGGAVAFVFARSTRRRLRELGGEMGEVARDMEALAAEIRRDADAAEAHAPAREPAEELDAGDEIAALGGAIRAMQTDLRGYVEYARSQAYLDPLTGLGSRAAYLEMLEKTQAHFDDGTADFCLTVFDADGLKHVNDELGHTEGDRFIAQCAAAVKAVYGDDHIYRIGGDEFVAVKVGAGALELEAWDQELRLELLRRRQAAPELPLSISWGSAVYDPAVDPDYNSVFKRADQAMYEAKRAHYTAAGNDRRRR